MTILEKYEHFQDIFLRFYYRKKAGIIRLSDLIYAFITDLPLQDYLGRTLSCAGSAFHTFFIIDVGNVVLDSDRVILTLFGAHLAADTACGAGFLDRLAEFL